jgi:ATP synthase I subunit
VEVDFDRGIARVPLLIAALGLLGSLAAWRIWGVSAAGAFLCGAAAAYFNFRLLERFVNRLGRLAAAEPAKPPKVSGARMFIQLGLCVPGAFVIIRLSGFNVVAALCGFLVCPAAVMVEILYELITYGHS